MKIKELQSLIKDANPEATVRLFGHGGPGPELNYFGAIGDIKKTSSLIFVQESDPDYFFEDD